MAYYSSDYYPAMRVFTDSFIVSNQSTQSVNFTTVSRIPLKTDFFTGKRIWSQPRKGILESWCHNLMREFFRLLWRNGNGDRKDIKCFKIVRKTNGLSVTENTNPSECTAAKNSIFAFAFDNISSLSSFWDLWMILQALWPSKSSCTNQKHCYR